MKEKKRSSGDSAEQSTMYSAKNKKERNESVSRDLVIGNRGVLAKL